MKRHLRDGWVQVFVAISAFSGIIGVFGGRTRSERVTPPAPVAAVPASPLSAPAAQLPAPAPAFPPPPPLGMDPEPDPPPKMTISGPGVVPYAPGAAPAPGPANPMLGIVQSLSSIAQNTMLMATRPNSYTLVSPKKKGRFLVAPPGDQDADTDSVANAVYSARDGETVEIKPGTYDGSFIVSKREVVIRGLGLRPQDVVIRTQDAGPAIMALDGAHIRLENLRVARMGNDQLPATKRAALYASGSKLTLRLVELHSREYMGVAVLMEQGAVTSELDLRGGLLDGDYADLVVRGHGKVRAANTRFLHEEQPVVLWRDASATLTDCDFKLSPDGALYAYEGSRIDFSSGPKRLVRGVREDARLTDDANLFSDSSRGQATSWKRSIFRAGRKPGSSL